MRNSLDEGSFLETMTLQYWNLSRAINNRCDTALTVADAITCAREALYNLKPSRMVAKRYSQVLNNLIMFGAGDAELEAMMEQDNMR